MSPCWLKLSPRNFLFFFFNDTATTEIYTLSLHDALPISRGSSADRDGRRSARSTCRCPCRTCARSEEHTSELQSRQYLVCRLLLEKKKKAIGTNRHEVGGHDCVNWRWCRSEAHSERAHRS